MGKLEKLTQLLEKRERRKTSSQNYQPQENPKEDIPTPEQLREKAKRIYTAFYTTL